MLVWFLSVLKDYHRDRESGSFFVAMATEAYILLFLGFILVRDYIQWRRSLERQEKLVGKINQIFGGGVVVSAAPKVSELGEPQIMNQIAKEDPNELDLQDMSNFDLPKDYNIAVEEGVPEKGEVRGGT